MGHVDYVLRRVDQIEDSQEYLEKTIMKDFNMNEFDPYMVYYVQTPDTTKKIYGL